MTAAQKDLFEADCRLLHRQVRQLDLPECIEVLRDLPREKSHSVVLLVLAAAVWRLDQPGALRLAAWLVDELAGAATRVAAPPKG